MRIALVTIGTRGDVVPYLAVSKALRSRGHEVVFATHAEHGPMVRAAGFALRPLPGGIRELTQTEAGKKWLSSADRPLEYGRRTRELFLPLQRPLFDDTLAATEDVDAVVFYALAYAGLAAAQKRGLPVVALSPWMTTPTVEVAPPGLEWTPRFTRRAIWELWLRLALGGLMTEMNAQRVRLGLPRDPSPSMLHALATYDVPVIHLLSEHVVPRPADWPERASLAGFALDSAQGYEPPEEVARFLGIDDPRPLVYVGFGSMAGHSPRELATLAASAARIAGVRMIYATGWGGAVEIERDDVLVLEEAPHDWLFPRVDAVVHHGGAGTFAAGLRAGKPTVIVAFFGDQPLWGGINAKLGTGPALLMRRGLTDAKLAAVIRRALDDPRHRERAGELARKLAGENGADRAAERIEAALTR
jgi:sterol 3beta-glucosyltransferase